MGAFARPTTLQAKHSPPLARVAALQRAGSLRGGSAAVLADHTAKAAALFGNMRVPAALFVGAVLPLSFGFPMPLTNSTRVNVAARRANIVLGVSALMSELVALTYSTVALNKLTEVAHAPAASVMALLHRDYERQWLGCNVFFLLGLFGIATMVGMRGALALGVKFGALPACVCASAIMLMTSIVNDGVRQGDGTADGVRFGASMLSLIFRYGRLLCAHAWHSGGPLAIASIVSAFAAGALMVTWVVKREPFE